MVEPYLPKEVQDEASPDESSWTDDEAFAALAKRLLEGTGAGAGYTPVAGEYTGDNTDGLHTKYEYVSGTAVMRPMAADGPGERVRLHAPYLIKIVWFSYERTGSWPTCPSPFGLPVNQELIRGELTLATPKELGNDRVYRASGVYVIEMLNGLAGIGIATWGDFPAGTSPESTASQNENTMPIAAFDPSPLGAGTFAFRQ